MDTFIDKDGNKVLILDDNGKVIVDKLKKKSLEDEDEKDETAKS